MKLSIVVANFTIVTSECAITMRYIIIAIVLMIHVEIYASTTYFIVRDSTSIRPNSSDQIVVRWVRVNEDDIPVVCAKVINYILPIPGATGCYGCKDGVCYVYTADTPEGMVDLGHEIKHCYDGGFHNTADWKWNHK